MQNWRPKTGENHHAMRARRFAERYIDDERLLATIEQHDRPYSLWRKMRRRGHLDEHAFTEMLDRIPDLDLFLRFVELDGSTEGKNHEPIRWLKAELAPSAEARLTAHRALARGTTPPAGANAVGGARRPGRAARPHWGALACAAARGGVRRRRRSPEHCTAAWRRARRPASAAFISRRAAGVATGVEPVGPPATVRRTAARSA